MPATQSDMTNKLSFAYSFMMYTVTVLENFLFAVADSKWTEWTCFHEFSVKCHEIMTAIVLYTKYEILHLCHHKTCCITFLCFVNVFIFTVEVHFKLYPVSVHAPDLHLTCSQYLSAACVQFLPHDAVLVRY